MDAGVLRVGVLLPPADVLAQAGAEVRALLQAWAADTCIELVFAAPSGDAKERAASAEEFIRREQLFALVSSFTDGADAELAAVAGELRVPLLATLSSHPQSANRYVFDLCAGIAEQEKALARFAAARGFNVTEVILIPASVAHPSLFERKLHDKVFVSFPIAPENPCGEALSRYLRLAEHAQISRRYQVSQFAALASAQLLMVALECAGRGVTREKVLDCLDRVTKLETGFVPPLTYRVDRRIGSTGSFIVELHSDRRPVWIDPGVAVERS